MWPVRRSSSSSTSSRLKQQRELLLQPFLVHLRLQFCEARIQPLTYTRLHFGQPRAHLSDKPFEVHAPLLDKLTQAHAFARTRGDELRDCLSEQRARRRDDFIAARVVFANHAGPAQQVHEIDGVTAWKSSSEFPHAAEQAIQSLLVDIQRDFCPVGCTEAHGAIHLPALQLAGGDLPQLRLGGPHLIGEAEAALQKTVIYAAKLADERPPGARGLPAGESGHAGDHVE